MKVNYVIVEKPIESTTSGLRPASWEITLHAEGNHKEMEWYVEQLNMIGRKEKNRKETEELKTKQTR